MRDTTIRKIAAVSIYVALVFVLMAAVYVFEADAETMEIWDMDAEVVIEEVAEVEEDETETAEYGEEAEVVEMRIGAAPGRPTDYITVYGKAPEDDFRESTLLTDLGLKPEQQRCLWGHAENYGLDRVRTKKIYVFYVATCWTESNFCTGASHKNSNGTTDRGPMQVNSKNVPELKKAGGIGKAEDLADPIKGLDAGCYLADQAIAKYGVTENAYFHYNAGLWAEGRSNKNSRQMWKDYNRFSGLLAE